MHTSQSHSNRNQNNYSYDYDATPSSDECLNSSSSISILYSHFERAQLDSSLRVLARQRSLALARSVDSDYVAELRRTRSCNVQTSAVVSAESVRDDRVLMKSKSKRRNGNSCINRGPADEYHSDNSLSRTGLEFTCGGICSFLPFAKQKPKHKHEDDVQDRIDHVSASRGVIMRRQSSVQSLEKFECGDSTPNSCSSSHLYFERPSEIFVELSNEAFSPVAAAFVFDRDGRCPPSALKKMKGSRLHVRFSIDFDAHLSSSDSSSSCNVVVTPRLRCAREEFNTYLAAQAHHSP